MATENNLVETDKERIIILEKIVAVEKKREEYALRLHRGAQVNLVDALKFTVSRLEAEIALEHAKAKAN